MLMHQRRGLANLLVISQAVLAVALFWLLYGSFVLVSIRSPLPFVRLYAIYCAVMAGGLLVELGRREPDDFIAPVDERSLVSQFPLALRQIAFALGSLLIFLALTQDRTVSRSFLAVFSVALYLLLVFTNAWLPPFFVRSFFRKERTLLVGTLAGAVRQAAWLRRKEQYGWEVCGVISTEQTEEKQAAGLPILGGLDELDETLDATGALQVILLEFGAPELARVLISCCQRRGARLLIVNDVAERIRHPTVCLQDEGLNIIALRQEPLENPFNRLLKRTLDIAIAAPVAVIVLPPCMALVWLFHRLQSPGPLWHRQPRAGLQNRTFEIIKFRTMHLNHAPLAQQASPGDARVFPAGRWLRRLSIDELPQCLNVLRGEMSIVGPRPHLIEHNVQFAEQLANYHIRTLIKPGITGLAQVRGFRGEARTAEAIAARLQSDLIYLENWSLSLEVGILARTAWQMIRPPSSAV